MDEKRKTLPSFADRLHWLRIRRGLSQAECAALTGISRSTYRRLEMGRTRCVKTTTVVRLAEVLGFSVWKGVRPWD